MSSNKYRIPELRASLCGCTLETASKIIGWFYLIVGGLTVIGAVIINFLIKQVPESKMYKDSEHDKKDLFNIFLIGFGVITWFMAFFGILQILINLLLLKGVYERKSNYIWPWVVCQLVFEVFNIIFELCFDYELEQEPNHKAEVVTNVFIEIIVLLFSLYCIWLVYSYYRQLKRQDDDLPEYQSHVYPV
ncbi:uncharacterized protein LOC142321806 [Lycorma delicatula]|uniref:uncharacterized protein LOC142321806 n=1 Tax=Lycorma delicatula TaxID=130591 RepID=UPI003F514AAB